MSTAALRQMEHLQKTLSEKAFSDANASALVHHPGLLEYSNSFEKSLPKKPKKCTQTELMKACKKSNVILYGDFHTHRQSQRGLVRLMRQLRELLPTRPIVLGMECFKERDTELIRKYLLGELSEAKFLRKTQYANDWGFPWNNYRMILETARDLNIAVRGINGPEAGRDSLKLRDRLAGRIITNTIENDPKALFLCMIGEHHLADNHLPLEIERFGKIDHGPLNVIRILNNIDQYFFHKPSTTSMHHHVSEILRLRPNMFCIMNSPPWIKWRSFAMWEEMRQMSFESAGDGETEDLIYTEDAFDLDLQFLSLAETLSQFLGLRLSKQAKSCFMIEYNPENQRLIEIQKSNKLSSMELESALQRVGMDGFYLFSKINRIVFSDLTLNHLAEAAGQFVQSSISNIDDQDLHSGEAFFRRVLKNAAGMIAGKILNPRRKGPTVQGMKQFFKNVDGQRLSGPMKIRRDTSRQILQIHQWATAFHKFEAERYAPSLLYKMDEKKNFEISRNLGLILGQCLYEKNLAEQLPKGMLHDFFSKPLGGHPSALHAFMAYYRASGL